MRTGPIHLRCYLSKLICDLVIAPPLARVAEIFKTEDVPSVDTERRGLFGYATEDTGEGLIVGHMCTCPQFIICRMAERNQQC